jgi:hypothetical protein
MGRLFLALAIAAVPVVTGASCWARTNAGNDDKQTDDVIVEGGRAPDNRFAITAHREWQGGGRFQLYLMAEPAHEKIAPLGSIDAHAVRDSVASAFSARWAPDSRHVALKLRTTRHEVTMQLFEIRDRRPHRLDGPTLFRAVARHIPESASDYVPMASITELTWLGPARFQLKDYRVYMTSTPSLARALGAYGRPSPSGRLVEFSAQAVGEFAPGDRYEVKDLKPGKFAGAE